MQRVSNKNRSNYSKEYNVKSEQNKNKNNHRTDQN